MITHFAASIASTLSSMRECSACHHKQLVSRESRCESVACKKCGASLPPARSE